jgi:predicted metallopeptidase
MKFINKQRVYTIEQIMGKYDALPTGKKIKILDKALTLALTNRAGTRQYAIANSMGYAYQDDGSYTK